MILVSISSRSLPSTITTISILKTCSQSRSKEGYYASHHNGNRSLSPGTFLDIMFLTLPALKRRGFFLHPVGLPLPIAGTVVEVPCPESFHGPSPSVSECPPVQPRWDERTFSRMFLAAF